MKKIIISLLSLITVAMFFSFSFHKDNLPTESDATNDNLVVTNKENDSSNNYQNNPNEKNNFLDNNSDLSEQPDNLEIADDKLTDSSYTVNFFEIKDNSKNNMYEQKPSSDASKIESAKPNTEKPSSNSSKPESTTQKPSSTSKPSDSKPETNTSKPSETKPNSSGTTSGNQSNHSGIDNKTESKPTHTHKWTEVYRTVSHKEVREDVWVVDTPAYTEEVPVYKQVGKSVCNSCKEILTKSNIDSHTEAHLIAGDMKAGWHTEYFREQIGTEVIEHKEVGHWESVVVKEAYKEEILTGYKCSCGATKSL